jgi:PKD repeat protein
VGEHPNANDADPAVNTASHEHREMISDPLVADATVYGPPLAWVDSTTGDETSDKCQYYFGPTKNNGVGRYNQVINGHQYLLQTEWSNTLAADDGLGCVMNATDRAPVAAFTASLNGPTLVADASGSGDPDAGDSVTGMPYFWEFGDGSIARGTTVKHKYASPGTYTVNVYVTDSFGATDVATKSIKVVNRRPAPTHSFSAKYDVNLNNVVFGFGNATGLGYSALDSFGAAFDGSDFPNSFTAFVDSGVLVRVADTFDQVYAPYVITLTDTADPPTGFNYAVTGTFSFQGGQGRYFDATGAGTITGTCTSSFDRPDADCTLNWNGTMAGA